MTHVPADAEEPVVLYRAAVIPGIRVLILVLATVAAVVPAGMLVILVAAALDTSRPHVALFAWSGAAITLLLLTGFGIMVIRGARSAFIVTTAGITIRRLVRTVRIPWSDVGVIQVDPRHMHRGEAVVVRRDGTRVGSPVTAARYAMRRGESTFDHGPELLHPAIPVRAAIDAHQRYLRGEFG